MIQPINDLQSTLLDHVVTALKHGGRLTDAILDYIHTTLFPPEPDRLAAFLKADTNSERDSLLDLIFYPDQAVQIDLEPLLELARFSIDDQKALHGRLMAPGISAQICMPDGRQLARIPVPDFIRSQYLTRLNIAWQMDPRVAAAIEKWISAARRVIVKVRLRNAGLRLESGRQDFLARFFERMADNDPDFLACLDLVLSILDNTCEPGDAYALLIAHKQTLFRNLGQARRFQTLLRHSNMETLMLQGVRTPHAACDALMRDMRLIDRVCFGVFGKTEAIDLPTEEPLREVTDLENPTAAMDLLLR
jgi:hypothetical protein